jgi:hypothetical protein
LLVLGCNNLPVVKFGDSFLGGSPEAFPFFSGIAESPDGRGEAHQFIVSLECGDCIAPHFKVCLRVPQEDAFSESHLIE